MKKSFTLPLEVDRELLEPYDRVARLLGVPFRGYVENYLRILASELETHPLQYIANEYVHTRYASRELAQAAAERFETYAIEEKLGGNSEVDTISASVAEYRPGDWRVKVYYLSQHGWKLIAADLWGEDDEDDAADSWKEADPQ